MHTSKAFVPASMTRFSNKAVATVVSLFLGVVMLSLLAQLKITLPWTPVPVTGQTFGVALLALIWGSRLSLATFASYLGLGFIGAPVFAGGASGFLIGPTFGYLVGMLAASWCVGKLSDRGWSESFPKALAACYLGSLIIFSCGVIGLSFFIPAKALLISGVLPFLPGDLIKNLLAAGTVAKLPLKK